MRSPIIETMTPEQIEQLEEKKALHAMNAQAFGLNKDIVQRSASMQDIHLNKEIYNKPQPVVQQPVQQPIPNNTITHARVPNSGFAIETPAIDSKTTKEFIDRLTSVEKKIDRFFDLIEKRVAKNAKEINIRIKLNENNDSTDNQ